MTFWHSLAHLRVRGATACLIASLVFAGCVAGPHPHPPEAAGEKGPDAGTTGGGSGTIDHGGTGGTGGPPTQDAAAAGHDDGCGQTIDAGVADSAVTDAGCLVDDDAGTTH